MRHKWTIIVLMTVILTMLLIDVSFAHVLSPPRTLLAYSQKPPESFWQGTAGKWITPIGAIVAALIAGMFGLWQLRKNVRAQKELDRERMEAQERLEREKILMQQQIDLETTIREKELETQQREAEAQAEANRAEEAQAELARTAEEQAISYRRRLISELRNLKILDMAKPLDLQTIYIQVRVRQEEPRRYVREEEIDRLAQGEPEEILRLSQVHLAERALVALAPQDAVAEYRHIVVLGDPGAGKTTMLRYLALQLAQNSLKSLPHLPVYVELRRFVDSGMDNLVDFAALDWVARYGFLEARSYLEQQLDAGQAVLLLDGLDEILGGTSPEDAQTAYDLVADEVNRLATRFSECPIVVTCRRAGWQGGLTAFQALDVLDFDWNQIQAFINNWFGRGSPSAEGLREALTGNLRMQTLAANPLILSLIAIVYERELELPERRAELYNRCVEVLLREWDTHRGIKRFGQFTTDRKRDLLEEIAWRFHRAGRRYFPENELLQVISEFLPTINVPQEENKGILDEIAAHYGLLKVQAHGWYGFLHLTLQEYFAAVALNERGAPGLQEVVVHRHDPWWEEVLLLLAARMTDATPLLLGILGRSTNDAPLPNNITALVPEGTPLAADDDLFHSDLLMAARCLIGTPRIRLHGLRERIIEDVKQVLATSPYIFDKNRMIRVLAEIDGDALTNELVDMLVSTPYETATIKQSISTALGEFGDIRLARQLLELLETRELDETAQWYVIDALIALQATFAVPNLIAALKGQVIAPMVQSQVARALGVLGDKSVAPELVVLLLRDQVEGLDEYDIEAAKWSAAGALALLGDESVRMCP